MVDSNHACHMVTNVQLIRIWNLERVEPRMIRQNEPAEPRAQRVRGGRRLPATIRPETGALPCGHAMPTTYPGRINKIYDY